MKLFSLKALTLAFVVVTGSAQATFAETVNNVCEKIDNICAIVSQPYETKTRAILNKIESNGWYKTKTNLDKVLSAPCKYYRITRTAFILGIAAAAYKTYQHFTKPAVDATEEGEIVKANKTATEVA